MPLSPTIIAQIRTRGNFKNISRMGTILAITWMNCISPNTSTYKKRNVSTSFHRYPPTARGSEISKPINLERTGSSSDYLDSLNVNLVFPHDNRPKSFGWVTIGFRLARSFDSTMFMLLVAIGCISYQFNILSLVFRNTFFMCSNQ